MVVYTPFWNTLRSSGESTYTLIKNHHISSSTIDKLRHNKPLNTTINLAPVFFMPQKPYKHWI